MGGAAGAIRAKVLKAEPGTRRGQVAAVTARGEILAAAPFDTGAGSKGEAALDLPLDLRNQVARLEIPGEDSAGAVYLLDSASQRRRVGLVASEGSEEAQPLLSPAYYLERALTPFAEVTRARTANLEHATADLVAASPSIIILSDVGRLAGQCARAAQGLCGEGRDAHPLCRPPARTGRRFAPARSVARGRTLARRHDDVDLAAKACPVRAGFAVQWACHPGGRDGLAASPLRSLRHAARRQGLGAAHGRHTAGDRGEARGRRTHFFPHYRQSGLV